MISSQGWDRQHRSTLGWLALLAGCARPPAAPPSEATGAKYPEAAAPASARPPATASAAPAEAHAPVAPPSPRWTTLADSDTCAELKPHVYNDFATFPTRPECEAWVKNRHCRPGFHCFDGCNWRSCDYSGSSMETTFASCSPGIVQFEFEPGQSKIGPSTNWPFVIDSITSRLRAPSRKLQLRGYAAPDEAKSAASVARLARARADAVAQQLAQRGISRRLLVIEVGSAAEIREHDPERSASVVMVSLLPAQPLRDDFDPRSSEHRLFCGASGWVR
jgi:outer membrane protein OmpA-like peptidoglycan-associated protein